MEHSEILKLSEGTLVQYWHKNRLRAAYFEKAEPAKRPKRAVLIPPMLGKKRIRIPISDLRGEVPRA